jgi:hypothetical protein
LRAGNLARSRLLAAVQFSITYGGFFDRAAGLQTRRRAKLAIPLPRQDVTLQSIWRKTLHGILAYQRGGVGMGILFRIVVQAVLRDYDRMADDRFTQAMDEAERLIGTGEKDEALEQLSKARREYLNMSTELYDCRLALGQTKKQ